MNWLAFIPGALRLVSNVVGGGAKKALLDTAEVVGGLSLTPEQQAALASELHEFEGKMRGFDVDVTKAAIASETAMIQSEDKYVSRARPTAVYAAVLFTGTVVTTVEIMLLRVMHVDWSVIGSITALITPMWGAVGYYFGQRTKEKLGGA